MDVVSYTALGSGGLAAMGVLESSYTTTTRQQKQQNWTVDDAVALAVQAVQAGIDHDLGSGSQVDICIIGPDGRANYTRCYVPEETLPPIVVSDPNATTATTTTTAARTTDAGSRVVEAGGVNGFGNLPYAIRSKRILRTNRERREQEVQDRWKDIISTSQ